MVYASDANKWRAYQFLDPFAAGSFLVCNKVNKIFCRPDCDAHPTTELRSLIKFVDTTQEAVSLGFVPCDTCGPMAVPKFNVNLLLRTVKHCNNRIGFVPPLMDDDETKIIETIKENIIGQGTQRRQLVPAVSFNSNTKFGTEKSAAYSVSKNDSEHYRLIDLACRHLALAAANSIFTPPSPSSSLSPGSPVAGTDKKKNTKKRRGGVLGFKELAAKSKLSAWHFHRVFKSITGLTPKNYGDMCWEYLEKDKSTGSDNSILSPPDSMRDQPIVSLTNGMSPTSSGINLLLDQELAMNNPSALNIESNTFSYISPTNSSPPPQVVSMGQKRNRDDIYDDDLGYSPKRVQPQLSNINANSNIESGYFGETYPNGMYTNNMKYEPDFGPYVDFSNRATSVPDLTMFGNNIPSSLFEHTKTFEMQPMPTSNSALEDLEVSDFSPTSIPMNTTPTLLIHEPYISTEEIINEAIYAEPEMFNSDLFAESRVDVIGNELIMGDPVMMGFAPEILSGIE